MTKCCLKNCSYVYRKGDGVKLHRFPINTERRSEWVKMVDEEQFQPTAKSVLCSKHFAADCYIRNVHGNIVLKPDAIPTIFPSINTEITIDTNEGKILHISEAINNTEEYEEVDGNMIIELETQENSMTLEETADGNAESYCVVLNDEQDNYNANSTEKYNEIYVQGPDGAIVAIIEEPIKDSSETIETISHRNSQRFPCFFSEFCYEDLECPVRRQKFWEVAQEMKATSTQKAQRDANYISSLRNKIVKLEEEIERLKQTKRILVYSNNKKKLK